MRGYIQAIAVYSRVPTPLKRRGVIDYIRLISVLYDYIVATI